MKIEAYSFGKMKIDGKTYDFDLIITPDDIKTDWWRKDGHSLHISDLKEVFDYAPSWLIIGRGAQGVMSVPDNVREKLAEKGFEIITAKTANAVDKYNEMRNQELDKPLVAGFHLTC